MVPIHIVDPDSGNREQYRLVLAKSFSLSYSDNASAALKALEKRISPIVIVNADLPDINGPKLCGQLRSMHPNENGFKLLLVGEAFANASLDTDSANSMGADDLLPLPFDASQLRLKIRNFILELSGKRHDSKETDSKTTEKRQAPQLNEKELRALVVENFGELSEADMKLIGENRMAMIIRLSSSLDEMDYYDILGLTAKAQLADIRKAYFSMVRQFHTDRFAMVGNEVFKREVGLLFKRMSESYQVLSDPEKRSSYDDLRKEKGELRFKNTSRENQGPRRPEESISSLPARKFFKLAMTAMGDGDYSSAKMNFSLALSLEPQSDVIGEKLTEVKNLLGEK